MANSTYGQPAGIMSGEEREGQWEGVCHASFWGEGALGLDLCVGYLLPSAPVVAHMVQQKDCCCLMMVLNAAGCTQTARIVPVQADGTQSQDNICINAHARVRAHAQLHITWGVLLPACRCATQLGPQA